MDEKRDAVRTGRAAARPARVALTHATGVLLAIVAVLSLFSANAYALPGSEKNGYPLGDILMSENVGANRGTAVYGAANEFFATLCLIGRKSDYLQLSNDQLAELSNEGTGGAFYELSQRWSNLASDGAPSDWPIGIGLAIEGQGLISDPAFIWYADYSYYESDSLYNRALADYMTIYRGGHLGSGSVSGDVLEFDVKVQYYTSSGSSSGNSMQSTDGTIYTRRTRDVKNAVMLMPNDIKLRIAKNLISTANIDDYPITDGCVAITLNSNYSDCDIRLTLGSNSSPCFTFNSASQSFTAGGISYNTTYYSSVSRNPPYKSLYRFLDNAAYTFDGSVITITSVSSASVSWQDATSTNDVINNIALTGKLSGSSSPVIPPTNWPDPPSNPVVNPPEVPEPQEPTGPGIDPPNPIGYTIDPTDDPDPVTDPYVVVVAPDSQDIIPWLRAILQAINNLGDKLNDESTELQRALNDVFFGNLSKLLKNIKGEFLQDFTQWLDLELEWMMESIESLFLDLQDYLHDLFEWLADQMNFEFDVSTDPYDDTSLLNWLRRIYNKLGADGGPNTRPVDPSTDPEGFLDWLRRIIAEFILGLGASASDFVSDLGDLLSRLFAKFPFSVPWDLLGILGLLDAAPVAPRANFTIPLTIGNQEFSWTVDINLQGWSVYMESVRTIILVSFISWLAWLTPSVLRDLDPGDFL